MVLSIRRVSRRRVRVTITVGDSTLTIDIHQHGVGGRREILSRQPHYIEPNENLAIGWGMSTTDTKAKEQREPRDLRYRKQFFPEAHKLVFDTKRKGFIPLPIMFRKLIHHLSAPELRVLIYLQLRASRYGICYPTLDEMVHELGLSGRKNLTPHLEALEKKRFISTHAAVGKRFFLIHDPHVPIEHLVSTGQIGALELDDINELYRDLGQEPLSVRVPSIEAPQPQSLQPQVG